MVKIIKKRNLFLGFLLTIVTFGIYILYWFIQTKKEIKNLGGEIPTSWLLIIPIVNIYWSYKYCEAFGKIIKKENNGLVYFLLNIVFFPIFPILIQSSLNNFEEENINNSSFSQESISTNEGQAKNYIEQYKSQFSRESIKTGLTNTGMSEDEIEKYLNKYF